MGRLKGRGEKEKLSAAQAGVRVQPLGGSCRVGVCQGGLVSFCLCRRGAETETEEKSELSWNSGAICHIGMALELPRGPTHSRRVFRSQSGEMGGAWRSREGSEVMAYSSSGGASVSMADGRVEREKEGQEGDGREARLLPGLHFPWHACKTCRRD